MSARYCTMVVMMYDHDRSDLHRASRRDGSEMPEPGDAGYWRRGPMAMDPALDAFRLAPTDRCWWCGDKATTEEHRFKHSTLRRIGRADTGVTDPQGVFKVSGDFQGPLRSLNKGSQVRWRKNLCAKCNNQRSQPFDIAYDVFEAFVIDHADEMMKWKRLAWQDIYGPQWQKGALELARYVGKQIGCMLATQQLPVPDDLVDFLNGAERCPSVCFMINLNWRGGDAHRMFLRHGFSDGLTTFVGLLPSVAYQTDGRFSGVTYSYHIGYVWLVAEWLKTSDRTSWWEFPEIDIPLVNGDPRGRVEWWVRRVRIEAKHLGHRLLRSEKS